MPLARPANWLDFVNEPLTAAEVEGVRVCVQRGGPYGEAGQAHTARQLGLQATLRPRGRPRLR
jgi:REP-associated tyrosine transposase